MPLGMIILIAVAILIFLGLAQRVLDRMRLSDRAALVFIAAMLVGGYLPDIPLADNLSINIGGGLVPLILVGYLFYTAGTAEERWRATAAIVITTAVVYVGLKLIPLEPTYSVLIDPLYFIGIIAGITGYLSGRSRRSAFMAGITAIVLTDIISRIENLLVGGRGTTVIGGAGIFDATVITGLLAVGLAEAIGETRERLQGGPSEQYSPQLQEQLSDIETGEIGEPEHKEGQEEQDRNDGSQEEQNQEGHTGENQDREEN
ncbi:MAG: DUF1614 domain-containing protein [Dethiobacteria bacterium]|jgi:hypothetical protein